VVIVTDAATGAAQRRLRNTLTQREALVIDDVPFVPPDFPPRARLNRKHAMQTITKIEKDYADARTNITVMTIVTSAPISAPIFTRQMSTGVRRELTRTPQALQGPR
jgi:hypothetical protein